MIFQDHMKDYYETQKIDILGLFLQKNDFKIWFTVNFLEKHPHFGGLETTQSHKGQT